MHTDTKIQPSKPHPHISDDKGGPCQHHCLKARRRACNQFAGEGDVSKLQEEDIEEDGPPLQNDDAARLWCFNVFVRIAIVIMLATLRA